MNYFLYIGNKNYSTWSMRPWVIMKHFDLNFDEKWVRFDSFETNSRFKQTILPLNSAGTVPILIDNGLIVTDSLAICEYLAEKHPEHALWPKNQQQRASARRLAAEMHCGYTNIRHYLPMNIEASFAEIGQIILRDHPKVNQEITFLDQHLSSFLQQSTGKYLFGEFTIADAFYAPMCLRLKNFHIQTSTQLANYIETICHTKGVKEWIFDAINEQDFIPMDEPYRLHR
ncbi:glutathione S-transferase [Orbus hercynius]|uniref:Glutathione S-transferase n=1 Tax=Orbus hercynius TaxID=593135 RepID=A0A495RJ00_9GAMM|nr:glutathione S-transferase N-terminal domain-containing protein [Orbus hercynius]RKS87477.1 glutathione S-transferase [Orbus hercynius]